jgi:hypothetical protein
MVVGRRSRCPRPEYFVQPCSHVVLFNPFDLLMRLRDLDLDWDAIIRDGVDYSCDEFLGSSRYGDGLVELEVWKCARCSGRYLTQVKSWASRSQADTEGAPLYDPCLKAFIRAWWRAERCSCESDSSERVALGLWELLRVPYKESVLLAPIVNGTVSRRSRFRCSKSVVRHGDGWLQFLDVD